MHLFLSQNKGCTLFGEQLKRRFEQIRLKNAGYMSVESPDERHEKPQISDHYPSGLLGVDKTKKTA
jgi:hypothetical protein